MPKFPRTPNAAAAPVGRAPLRPGAADARRSVGPDQQINRSANHPRSPSATRLVRANGRPADVVAFEEALVAFFVDAADLLGVPKSVGAIYAISFASPEPLSFSEIDERLQVSSGSISQGLRVLREVGALRVVQAARSEEEMKGSRVADPLIDRSTVRQALARQRERYEPDMHLRNVAMHFLENRLAKQLDAAHARLKAVAKIVPRSANDSAKLLRARLESLQSWHDKTRSLLPIAKTFLTLS